MKSTKKRKQKKRQKKEELNNILGQICVGTLGISIFTALFSGLILNGDTTSYGQYVIMMFILLVLIMMFAIIFINGINRLFD